MVLPCLHGSHRRGSQHSPNMPPIFVNNSYGCVSKLGVQRENFPHESCSKSLAQWNAKVSTGMFFLRWDMLGDLLTHLGFKYDELWQLLTLAQKTAFKDTNIPFKSKRGGFKDFEVCRNEGKHALLKVNVWQTPWHKDIYTPCMLHHLASRAREIERSDSTAQDLALSVAVDRPRICDGAISTRPKVKLWKFLNFRLKDYLYFQSKTATEPKAWKFGAARRPNPSTSWSLKFRSWARQRDSKSRKDIIDSDGDTVAALAPLGPNWLDVKLVSTNWSEHSSGISSFSWLHLFGSSKNSVAAAAVFTNASMLVIVSALCFKVEHRFCLAQSLPFKRSS